MVSVGESVFAESGAIIEEVVDRCGEGRLRPAPATPDHVRYRYWLHYAEGSLTSPLLVALIMGRIRSAKLPFFISPIVAKITGTVSETFTKPELESHFGFVEAALAESP